MQNYPLAHPQAINQMFDINQWESQLQQLADGIEQLPVPTQNLRLKLMRDQYADKSRDLLETVRRWYRATDDQQKLLAFKLMMQKYTLLNSMWLQIAAMSGRLADPVES
jgi:hypothetical protein